MSKIQKRKHTSQFKLKLAVEAIETDAMPAIARKYGIAHSLLAKWKRKLLEDGHYLYELRWYRLSRQKLWIK